MTPEQVQVQKKMERFAMDLWIFVNLPDEKRAIRVEERLRLKNERLLLREEFLRLKEGNSVLRK